MTSIAELTPQSVWGHFANICNIPRPSHHEQGVVEYLLVFARKHGLDSEIDPAGNVIIRKPASPGMDHCYGIIMQGHMDMVAQKSHDSTHDFEKDPIQAYIDGDWVAAKDTTLGADNGIGVAAALAVLESSELKHPNLEALFTVNEECGMSGALELQPGYLKGDWLINMDTEEDGELYVGCAGGVDLLVGFPVEYTEVDKDYQPFKLVVGGLKGGHSGVDIHLGRANANIITNEFLMAASDITALKASTFDGGSLRNALPRDAVTQLWSPADKIENLTVLAQSMTSKYQKAFANVDPDICVELNSIDDETSLDRKVLTDPCLQKFVGAVANCPNGVNSWIPELPDVVETSSNLARVLLEENKICLEISIRSSVETSKMAHAKKIAAVFENVGARTQLQSNYPGWKPEMESQLLQLMKEQYQSLFGKPPGVKVIHAGLECGVLGAIYPHWQMISFGPTIVGAHSPDEKIRIEDVDKMWRYVVQVLANIPVKTDA